MATDVQSAIAAAMQACALTASAVFGAHPAVGTAIDRAVVSGDAAPCRWQAPTQFGYTGLRFRAGRWERVNDYISHKRSDPEGMVDRVVSVGADFERSIFQPDRLEIKFFAAQRLPLGSPLALTLYAPYLPDPNVRLVATATVVPSESAAHSANVTWASGPVDVATSGNELRLVIPTPAALDIDHELFLVIDRTTE
jgi:hypothetical protein